LNLVYYITGHGYGHTVRSIEVVKSLKKNKKDIFIHIRTTAPEWLFKEIESPDVQYINTQLDFGVIQNNSFKADKQATLQKYSDLLKIKKELINNEVDFFKSKQIDLVISDITPFAFDAAAKAGIPGIAIGNFSWDWIYTDYIKDYLEYAYVIKDVRQSYQKATILYKLPLSNEMSVFSNIESVPLIARKASLAKHQARLVLGLPDKAKIILLALREDDLSLVNRENIQHIKDYLFVLSSCRIDSPNTIYIPEGTLNFENILVACDMVLSKPGYSLISECLANKIKILYVPREDFLEDQSIEKTFMNDMTSVRLPMDKFISGKWQQFLEKLDNKKENWTEYPANGADIIAEKILTFGK